MVSSSGREMKLIAKPLVPKRPARPTLLYMINNKSKYILNTENKIYTDANIDQTRQESHN